MAVCLASGQDFFGRKVKERVGVVFVAAEGRNMFPARIEAAKLELGVKKSLPIAWPKSLPDFSKANGIEAFIGELKAIAERMRREYKVRLGIVFIDTVSANFDIEDENDNAEAARVCRILRRIGDAVNATTAPLCHVGKNVEAGLRGASAYRANADFVLSVGATIDLTNGATSDRSLSTSKDRDGKQGPLARFSLRFVKLGVDEDKEQWGTMVAVPEEGIPVNKRGGWTKTLIVFRQALNSALLDYGVDVRVRGDGPRVRAVEDRFVREEFNRIFISDDADPSKDARRMRYKRNREAAQNARLVGAWVEGKRSLIWPLDGSDDQTKHQNTLAFERTEHSP
jgi:hypothetical protein